MILTIVFVAFWVVVIGRSAWEEACERERARTVTPTINDRLRRFKRLGGVTLRRNA